jgi:hypothetical protein
MVCLIGILFLSAGCGGASYDGPKRSPVTGSVTLDGAPVPFGTITFKPVAEGRLANGSIEEGKYSIPEEMGPTPGKYKVDIRGYAKSASELGDGEGGGEEEEQEFDMGPEIVPTAYNTETTLEVEITGGANTHDFALTGGGEMPGGGGGSDD